MSGLLGLLVYLFYLIKKRLCCEERYLGACPRGTNEVYQYFRVRETVVVNTNKSIGLEKRSKTQNHRPMKKRAIKDLDVELGSPQ
jgi:hypothetical protein